MNKKSFLQWLFKYFVFAKDTKYQFNKYLIKSYFKNSELNLRKNSYILSNQTKSYKVKRKTHTNNLSILFNLSNNRLFSCYLLLFFSFIQHSLIIIYQVQSFLAFYKHKPLYIFDFCVVESNLISD